MTLRGVPRACGPLQSLSPIPLPLIQLFPLPAFPQGCAVLLPARSTEGLSHPFGRFGANTQKNVFYCSGTRLVTLTTHLLPCPHPRLLPTIELDVLITLWLNFLHPHVHRMPRGTLEGQEGNQKKICSALLRPGQWGNVRQLAVTQPLRFALSEPVQPGPVLGHLRSEQQ